MSTRRPIFPANQPRRDFTRRDFLKLLSVLPPAFYLPPAFSSPQSSGETPPNILILLFDAWSASNTSLYGYPRKTTPNIDRLAEKAIVYHNHYASGHYTYPSTASLLTGVLPWTHKGYWDNPNEQILEAYHTNNLFSLFDSHHRSAYTNNLLVSSLLEKMSSTLDLLLPKNKLALPNNEWFEDLFHNDSDISLLSWIKQIESMENKYANSLFLSRLYEHIRASRDARFEQLFPRGIPAFSEKHNFILETATDWVVSNLDHSQTPYISYVHLYPPHAPYRTRWDFIDAFKNDGYTPIQKPPHPLRPRGGDEIGYKTQIENRRLYDEFILYADIEFGRLMDELQERKILENTIVILTSDHGEMFERGIRQHLTPSFHKPLMHVPLLIFLPGQEEQVDIHSLTTTIDLLPTLLQVSGKPVPDWLEGEVLPPFNAHPKEDRSIFSVDFRRNPKTGPVANGTIMLGKGAHKLTYLFGSARHYKWLNGESLFELFNLEEDPEELNNLFDRSETLTRDLLGEVKAKLAEKDLLKGILELEL